MFNLNNPIYFHIGYHRTGTTFLQKKVLSQLKDQAMIILPGEKNKFLKQFFIDASTDENAVSNLKTIIQTIGKYPALSINDARDIVAEKVSDIKHGVDILKKAREKRYEDTFDVVFKRWLELAKLHKRSWVTDSQRYDRHIKKKGEISEYCRNKLD